MAQQAVAPSVRRAIRQSVTIPFPPMMDRPIATVSRMRALQ